MNNYLISKVMKRIMIALAILLSVQVADAQVKTPEAAKKAIESAKAVAENPKKATKVATWLKLASAYMDAYNAPQGSAWLGASKQELQLIMGGEKPVSVGNAVLGGEQCTKEVYANKELYFNQNGQLIMINVTKPVDANALAKALDAYKKAYEVDVKKSKEKDVKEAIGNIAKKYLDLFCKKSNTAKQYVQKWMPIDAASQSVKGNDAEREFLLSWVDVVDYE